MALPGQSPHPIGPSFVIVPMQSSVPGPSPFTRVTMATQSTTGPHVQYEPRHRTRSGTPRRLRRSLLLMTLAATALMTAGGGSTGPVLTSADTLADPTFPTSSSTPSQTAWDDPVVATSSRGTQHSARAGWRAGADRIDAIPDAAVVAYQRSAAVIDEASPGSRLHWTLLAAVGRVLTDHGRRGGHRVDDQGNVRPGIVGKPLLARGGKRVGDTEAGLLDADRRFDRPVGPMLLTPADWTVVGVDGDADGKRNPQDLDDASLALAVLLCTPGKDLRTIDGKRAALRRIDNANDFGRAVLEIDASYRRQLRSGAELVEPEPLTTLPELPSLPAQSSPKPDRTAPSRPPADSGTDSGVGPDNPAPEPDALPTSTEVTATYDSEGLQINATAVVSADGAAPTGGVAFALIGAGGVRIVQVPLAGGSATARFEVAAPGTYTVVASYAGTKDHSGSKSRYVVQVTVSPGGQASPPTDAR